MKYAVPAFGLILVVMAILLALSECRRVLVQSNGDLQALRSFGLAWMVLFAVLLGVTLVFRQPAMYVALAGLAIVIWVSMPTAVYMSWRIRRDATKL